MKKIVLLIVLCLTMIVLLVGGTLIYNYLNIGYNENDDLEVVDDSLFGNVENENNASLSNEIADESNVSADVTENNAATDNNNDAEPFREETVISENAAPDVEFYNSDGSSIMLSSFYNKPVVINFWATWCGPCKSEMPGFNRLYKKYKDKVNFVMLNVSDSEKTVSDFLSENGYDFPVYFDKTQVASYTYGASSIPLTFVLYQGGEVFGYQIGVLSEEALERAIKTLLGEE